MSRIGKLPIAIPTGVTITVDPDFITVQGPKGTLKQFTLPEVDVNVEDGQVIVTHSEIARLARSQHGLMRALINNMVIGVTKGFEKKLQINGVGFRLTSQARRILKWR